MGKRKYAAESEESSINTRTEETPEEVENAPLEQPQTVSSKRPRLNGFDIKHLRKELASKQGQSTALTQFLQVCLNPDNDVDYLLEYLKTGGNSHEILRQLTPENKKNLSYATPVFHLFHLITLKVQSALPHLISITEEACRYFLNTFMPTVEVMISESSSPRHRKIILKLLTSMVTLNPDLGIEVLNQAPLTPKHLQYITEKANYKEKDNVRTSFVHFMTSFLVDGHLPLIKALLEKQGLLGLVIPGLIQDEAEAVLMFLNILKKNVVDNGFISKSLKLKTFSHQALHNMFKIFSWKGPQELSHADKNELRTDIANLLSDILLTLFTSHRTGLYFTDNFLGTTDANKNPNLYKALLSLNRPWENDNQCDTVLKIISRCPDLHRAVITVVEQSFEPQHSALWERNVGFVYKLLDNLKPENLVSRLFKLSAVQVANFVRFVTLPIPLLRIIQQHIGKDPVISLHLVKVLVKTLQTLRRYMQILEMQETSVYISELKNKLEYTLPKHLPVPSVVVQLIDDVVHGKSTKVTSDYSLEKPDDTEAMTSLIELLLLYNDIHPMFFETLEGNIDMKNLLEFSKKCTTGHVSLLKFKIVSLWLMLDDSAISLKNKMFKELFLIMLEVYTSDDGDTWIEAKETLQRFFKNTAIFEGDEDEIHLVLYVLRNCKIKVTSLIGDIVEYTLGNRKNLTEYVRQQTVHYEITDQSSEATLKKLFYDLMQNKSSQDHTFLEMKIPSPFIVGCIQYIADNKEARKSLKHFLSLYIANLLHFNYSPELTEIFIGDSKLEARNYVGSWVGEPVAVSESISGKDDVLKNLSKSLIDKEDIAIHDIFPFLELTSEESDIIVGEVGLKVILNKNVDGSDLLIWAKYLMFCTVRLTNMSQLEQSHITKITDYFECIIAAGRKHHMVNVCRAIILTLFKNPHFLKVYTPVNLKNEPINIIATSLFLKVVNNHTDIVNYLNKKNGLLKAYQQKNVSEIVKAFIKINKKKNVDSIHTIQVLEVVGLANEDDMLIFEQIFSADVSSCIKDDKEPSLVLEILKVLIEKYSKSVSLDLSQNVLKKAMKLYTDLLTSNDVIPNLTNLENAFIQHFENKPLQATHVTDDIFKQFFYAKTMRKSTYQLASILIKCNWKFCNLLKEEIKRQEILSQREVTLPLGDAAITHHKFLIENKDFLGIVYNEYKTNIQKVLEKPHKAGQIYVTCWRLVRKLVLECMDLQDCEKLFTKPQKYETVELCHVHLLESVFLKLCLHEKYQKKDLLVNYFLTTLNLATIAIKETKESPILQAVISNIFKVMQVSGSIQKFKLENKEGFDKVTNSAIWQNFCKAVLKDSLKIKKADQGSTCGPQLLCLLTGLVKLFYPSDHEDIVGLFDMVTSHSEFLNVMLSHHSVEVKSRLIEFIFQLIQKNKSVMKTQQVPVYLSAYHATRNTCDRLLLSILHYYEANGVPVNEYKPYVWGDSAANHYAVRKNRSASLWAHPTPNQVLNLFEKEVIERTVRNFPVHQKLEYSFELPPNISVTEEEIPFDGSVATVLEKMSKDGVFRQSVGKDVEVAVRHLIVKAKYGKVTEDLKDVDLLSRRHGASDEGMYDPVFVFPLLSHVLAPGSVASCFRVLRAGLLSLPLVALGSHHATMRAAAYHVLHRFCMLLETETRHKNDKLFLTDFINTLRQSLRGAIVNGSTDNGLKNPRLPAVSALYLARALMVATAPFDPLYKPVNNFFIAKDTVDLTVVPDFLSLFHDSDVESADRRLWILDIIKDGTKTMTDVTVVFKTMCLKMIMDYHSSVLSDKKAQEKIVGVLRSIAAVPKAFDILVEGYGLLSWLHSVVRRLGKNDRALAKEIFALIEAMMHSSNISAFSRNINAAKNNSDKNGKVDLLPGLKTNKDTEHDILSILHDLSRHIEYLEADDVNEYLRIYRLFSKRTLKSLSKRQIMNLVNVCGYYAGDSEGVKVLVKALTVNSGAILRSKSVDENNVEVQVLVKELTSIVQSYLA